jgi:hypothetical protein
MIDKEIQKVLEDHERRISRLEKALKGKPERATRVKKSVTDLIIELKNEEFFKEERTISQIRDALHTKGAIVKIESLPAYLLPLVRSGELKRRKKLIEKKKVWVYFA